MAIALVEKNCTPCRGGIPPLPAGEAKALHVQAPDWALLDDATRIERTYRFRNFREAFGFVERAASLAEREAHHPEIRFGWGFATVSCKPRRSKDCTKTTLSWRPSSIASPPSRGRQCHKQGDLGFHRPRNPRSAKLGR